MQLGKRTPVAYIGTALSILLSFKLNQSYDRWWEARKVWGAIVNDSRSLVIQLLTFTEKKVAEDIVKKIALRHIAWAYSLGQTLRKQDPLANTEELTEMSKNRQAPKSGKKISRKGAKVAIPILCFKYHQGGYLPVLAVQLASNIIARFNPSSC